MRLVRTGDASSWADRIAALLVERLRQRPSLRVCLPTGLTPVPIYDRLAAAVAAGAVSFRDADVVLLDEFGGVSTDDPGRCDRMLQRALLDRVDLPPGRFHRLAVEDGVEAACAAHERAVGDGCDLTILGIGGNGHIGMNEPGSPADSLTRRVALAAGTTAASARYFGRDTGLPTWGVTMGVGTILRSREIWLLAAGTAKAAIVRDALEGPITPEVPASLLRTHPGALLIADDDAAALCTDPGF